MPSLYIHFPFCLYKCHYCDFNSHARASDKIPFLEYAEALSAELAARRRLFEISGKHFFPTGSQLETVFFGGGTPSLMPPPILEKILEEVGKYFVIDRETEVTLEANPGTLPPGWVFPGVNRLSLGVQSLHDAYLAAFGRIHTAEKAREALRSIPKIFDSWSADLIFGFPGQTLKEWKEDLEEMIAFSPPHLSCYAFTVEKEAPYARMAAQGSPLPDEDLQAEMLEETRSRLEMAGYNRYEISNFSRPGFESRHNMNYWNYGSYLGIGAGAVSFFNEGELRYRTTNLKRPEEYMRAWGKSPLAPLFQRGEIETIDHHTAKAEFMMMGLRLKRGIDPDRFKKLFGVSVDEAFGKAMGWARDKGWMEAGNPRLTSQGAHFSNQVITSFL